jgi:transcription elongation factor GreB
MSKAFTKEDHDSSSDLDPSSEENAEQSIPKGQKNYITQAGAERLKSELHQLLYEQRPSLVQTVAWAASNGDRSENGDYIYGKKRLREIDRRIRFLTKRLEIAEIVPSPSNEIDRVVFGVRVTVQRVDDDVDHSPRSYRIVGIDEANAAQGEISWISPMAKALLNHKVGDLVLLKTPRGEEELEILKIQS